ncbi:MAG: PQQ-binding-like beta-propeller repeat protein [Candidatus Dormibacteria bacterium]
MSQTGKEVFAMTSMRRGAWGLLVTAASVAVSVPLIGTGTGMAARTSEGAFNAPGNVLISDQFNNRVIEVNSVTKSIVWSFGSGNPSLCNPGPGAIIGLNDAERLSDGLTLLAGTGVPLGSSPANPTFSCVDNRVIIVNHAGTIVWQYGQAGVTGSGPDQLNVPVFAIQLPNRNIMIVDQGNNRVIEVGFSSRTVVWSYGPASGPGALNNPNSAELLDNGHILIADENNNRVIEITRSGRIVWQYGSGSPTVTTPLQFAAFASRLANGDTLITDSGHSRIVEVNEDKHVVFQYFTNTAPGSATSPLPTNAVRLKNGAISIADQFNHRAILISPTGRLLEQIGETGIPGSGFDQLDGPYTAFVIGDYTGQTPPP